jgi:phosphoglycerate dehydrogenase-like enzyme
MKVIAYDPFLTTHAVAELKTLDEVLAQSDVITIHTPLTDQTRGMFNKDAFAKMKDGVMIINTARGKVIAEADLAEALKSGKVRAYGTDVWFSDPPPADCPLLTAPNVFMAPHIGGSSKENLLRIGDTVVEILSRFKV